MNHGAGWIVFEESYHKKTRALLSLLPARKTESYVSEFMRQLYLDRQIAIQERLNFKKQPRSTPFQVMRDINGGVLHIGHDPFYVGIYAHSIILKGSQLTFHYRICVDSTDPHNLEFESRSQFLEVDV